jgi:hypothetical protein
MGIKILVGSSEEQDKVMQALEFAGDAADYHESNVQGRDEDYDSLTAFLQQVTVTVGTAGSLDTALMSEIGKAYRERYEEAVAQKDEENKNKMIGAMFAIKRIMEMVEDPKY